MMTAALLCLTLVKTPPGLTASDVHALHTTKQIVYLPTWIPAGYKGEVNVNLNKEAVLTDYQVTYTKGTSSFTIQTASDGIGDIFLETADGTEIEDALATVRNSVLGGTVEIRLDKKTKTQFVVNWIEVSKKKLPLFVGLLGEHMKLNDIKHVVSSVRRIP